MNQSFFSFEPVAPYSFGSGRSGLGPCWTHWFQPFVLWAGLGIPFSWWPFWPSWHFVSAGWSCYLWFWTIQKKVGLGLEAKVTFDLPPMGTISWPHTSHWSAGWTPPSHAARRRCSSGHLHTTSWMIVHRCASCELYWRSIACRSAGPWSPLEAYRVSRLADLQTQHRASWPRVLDSCQPQLVSGLIASEASFHHWRSFGSILYCMLVQAWCIAIEKWRSKGGRCI